ncbi:MULTISPECIES: ribbon-helix-helix protein, CopG family [unclassified Halobacterium]|jgi:predicted transcriptional regulator|nr:MULTISPECIES: ribbon-helix-helix protein, CopG family [unclassified Halobacterium]MCD2198761.1 ribbon-helix-helix protein, CopG family [Halobacterium sp. KA-4]MCD2202778.1 ribbon-helix-helix protein, CopG family [Halobacterium sp. KA-6]
MPRKYSVVCGDSLAADVEELAREYGLSEQEVLRQLIENGLEEVD